MEKQHTIDAPRRAGCGIRFLCYSARMSFTYKPKKRKRAKTHGFLVRSKSTSGRKVLAKRRQKGRKKITTV